jgi:hypothetical protein
MIKGFLVDFQGKRKNSVTKQSRNTENAKAIRFPLKKMCLNKLLEKE